MAYVSTEQTKAVKKELTKEFPGYKFSVTADHSSVLVVSIIEAPVSFTQRSYEQLNHFYLDRYSNSDVLERIRDIANKGNYDKSDAQTDHFDVGFYFRLEVGKWDKPFKLI